MTPPDTQLYFPEPGNDWKEVEPEDVALNPKKIDAAIRYALQCDSPPYWGDDYAEHKAALLANAFGPDADVEMVGAFTPPTQPSGLIIRHGYLAATFGDLDEVSEIASATKSFLSTVMGLAFDRGLIRSVDDRVSDYLKLEEFSISHNSQITWRHLLQQTSEWDGTLFGKQPSGHKGERVGEALHTPGTYFEYNDVRVNLFAYCLLHLWKRSLPDLLKELIMDPIAASDSWQWHGYRNSTVELDGTLLTSVSGGSHWGGGLWMSARDLARYGYLHLRKGMWNSRALLSNDWIEMMRISCPQNYMYGYMWWLKHDATGKQIAFAAEGGGGHTCTVIPEYDMVVVARWVEGNAYRLFLESILDAPTDAPRLGNPVIDFSRVNSG